MSGTILPGMKYCAYRFIVSILLKLTDLVMTGRK